MGTRPVVSRPPPSQRPRNRLLGTLPDADFKHLRSDLVTTGALQAAGLITYKHGRITIVDRSRLELASCECYAVVRGTFDALLT